MAKHDPPLTKGIREVAAVTTLLGLHIVYLFKTTFVAWPEMLLYPWFASRGLIYYRDVAVPFPPGVNWLLSLFYGLIGYGPEQERIIAYVLILLTDVLVYTVVRKFTRHTVAALGALAFFVIWQPVFYGNTLWHETVMAPIVLIMFLLVFRYRQHPGIQSVMALGSVIAVLTLMKQTIAWSVLAVALYLLVTGMHRMRVLRDLAVMAGIVLLAHGVTYASYALQGAGPDYLFWAYQYPFSLTQSVSRYGVPMTRSDLMMIGPAFIPLLLLPVLGMRNSILLILWTAALFLMALPRWGIFRLQPALALASVGFGLFLTGRKGSRIRGSQTVRIAALVVLIIFGWRSVRVNLTIRDPMQPQFFGTQYQSLLNYVKTHTTGPVHIVGNYDYLYFGLDSTPAILPWYPLFPWNAELPGAQERLAAAIERSDVRYVLYIPHHGTRGFYDDFSPDTVMHTVKRRYRPVGSLPVPGGLIYERR